MYWHAMPPELNTARLMAGAGPAPMLQAAAGWEVLAGALETQALELSAALISLKAAWTGMSSERAIAAAAPMVVWLQIAAQQAQERAVRATAQAASYTKALAMTPSLPEIATNHVTHAVLTATNFLGINLVPIGFNETDYFVRMWTQAAAVTDIYQVETIANTTFEPLPPAKPILQPGVGEPVTTEASAMFSAMGSEAIPGVLRGLSEAEDEIPEEELPETGVPLQPATPSLDQIGQLGAPMQQLMQPLQQMTSMAGQTGGMGGPKDGMLGDKLGHLAGKEHPNLGLIGASPLSNHPLAGGSGSRMGMGLMRSEALPGAGGTAPRTSLMSQLVDKPTQVMAPAGAGAGSSAAGGAAPVGMGGAGAGSQAAATRPGLAAPALLAPHPDEDDVGDFEHEDDW
ncbi:PPE family protein [Mycobacterium montefiorense]|uniref:PPE family protein n=1 Tax=Mycobacterium montefiorense TaxID=154654 RepID=UPI0021DE9592|nr:PPE family protein [Mycobacterium montefiorense]MCV7429646.1 PPE family protein [Mycobacterium montefiorense]GLE52675.1 PPE family immunomodulator PPE68 [Mycobacterium montefiorense]